MKKFALPFLSGIILTLVCIGVFIAQWWYGFIYPPKNAQCLPMEYPEHPFDNAGYANPHILPYRPVVLRTGTSLEVVKDYYEANLTHNSNWDGDDEGYWQRREVRQSEFLYECSARLGFDELEKGCIYVRERDGKTIVERIWLFAASGGPACETFMSELPIQR